MSAYTIDGISYSSVIDAMADNRVLKIKREADGQFRVAEHCDDCYFVILTPDQLVALGRELIEMAGVLAVQYEKVPQ